MEFKFDEFRVSEDQQVLVRAGEAQPIGTRIYYLLLVFVKNAGQVLSKDQIIETVWPRQIVTDAALAKQILRLRKILKDQDRRLPFIETHRGVGYRFTAAVQTVENNQASTARVQKRHHTGWYVFTGLATLGLLLWQLSRVSENPAKPLHQQTSTTPPIVLAILPSGNNAEWLNRGGLDYFAELLTRNELINAINPEPEWYTLMAPEKFAIELTTHKNINYSCIIDIRETGSGYQIQAKLRTDSEIISTIILESATLKGVFTEANRWIMAHLGVREQLSVQQHEPALTDDSYALESYLQGIYELSVDDDKNKALEYFQAAVNKDPDFYAAWLRLGKANLDVTNYEKAISIAKTLLARDDVQSRPDLVLQFRYLTALAHARMLNFEEAAQYASLANGSLDQTDNPFLKMRALESLELLAEVQKNWRQAEIYQRQILIIAEEYYPLPNFMAGHHAHLAGILEKNKQPEEMKRQLELALTLYEETNNANGMIYAFITLAKFYLNTGRYDEGLLVASRAEPYLDLTTQPNSAANFMIVTGSMLNLRGMFADSEEYDNRMRALSEKTGNSFFLYVVEFLKLHRLYVQNRFEDAMKQVQIIHKEFRGDSMFPVMEPYVMNLGVLMSSRYESPDQTERRIEEMTEKFPAAMTRYKIELDRARGHLAVNKGLVSDGLSLLRQSEQAERDRGDNHLGNYTGFEILEILLNNPKMPYKETLARLEANTRYDYLLFKLKSQFLAREGEYIKAAMLMRENKLKANQLWKAEDQLLLEEYQQRLNVSE